MAPANLPQTRHLPLELLIHILSHADSQTLWRSIRLTNHTLRQEAETFFLQHHLPNFSLSRMYTLGSGSRHRWYDIRATVKLTFKSINKLNPQYALFGIKKLQPENYHERALEKWRTICAAGLSPGPRWTVRFEAVSHLLRLANLVAAEGGEVWCDWRELANVFFHELETSQSRVGEPKVDGMDAEVYEVRPEVIEPVYSRTRAVGEHGG